MDNNGKISIVIAEDSVILQDRIKGMLLSDSKFEILDIVSSGAEVIPSLNNKKPDIVMLDIEMETNTAGLDTAKKVKRLFPDVKIIMLTISEYKKNIVKAFEIGVNDYLIKDSTDLEIKYSIEAVYNGVETIKPRVARTLKKEIKGIRKTKEQLSLILSIVSQITPTEISILDELLQGKKQKDIASSLFIELSTVKTHINRLLKKFKMKKSSQMVTFIKGSYLLDFIKDR